MQPNRNEYEFTTPDFANLAGLQPNLRIDQIRVIVLAHDGAKITLLTTTSGERIADKRAPGTYAAGSGYAVDALAVKEGVILLSGTPGIQNNLARAAVVAGIQGLLQREGKDVLVCSKPQSTVAYYLYASSTAKPIELTAPGMDFAGVAYMPKPRGFVGREAGSNRLWFLPFERAKAGQINRTSWTMTQGLPGATAITALPPRIQNAKAVMVKTVTDGGNACDDTLNLADIAQGQIVSVASQVGQDGVTFRCFVSAEIAVVEVAKPTAEFEGCGTYQIPAAQLPQVFGRAGAKLVEAQAAI